MDTLQRAIQAKFPGMASVLAAVVEAEQMGSMLVWSGGAKKGFALRQLGFA